AEPARENLRAAIRLEAVDAELERDVARLLGDPVVDGDDLFALGGLALRDFGDATAHLFVGAELVLDETPVPRAHVVPRLVRRDVHVPEKLRVRRLERLRQNGRDVRRDETVDALLTLFGGRLLNRNRRLVEVERPLLRRDEHVLRARDRLVRLEVID